MLAALLLLPDVFVLGAFFVDPALAAPDADAEAEADPDAAGAADVPDAADAPGIVVKLDWLGVVRNTRTPMRPAIVPPSTIGVRFTELRPFGSPWVILRDLEVE
jgi:hypothetical protein